MIPPMTRPPRDLTAGIAVQVWYKLSEPWLNQNNTDNVSSDCCDSQFLIISSIIIY